MRSTPKSTSTYFPGLNTLRLYAALSVVLGHIIQNNLVSAHTGWVLNFFIMSGYDAVTLFFVISGFLITYLLLNERSENGSISVKNFLLRRFLRIQPVYFVVLLLSILLFPQQLPSHPVSWFYILIWSPHIPEALLGLSILAHYWSIGVEEWYYFGLPFLFRRFGVIRLVLGILLIRLILGAVFFPETLLVGARYGQDFSRLFTMLRFESMAVGGFFAWLFFYRHNWLRVVYFLEPLGVGVFIVIVLLPFEGSLIFDFILSIMFAVVVVCCATKPKPLLKIEHPYLRRLGEITYGVYMYHMLFVSAGAVVVRELPPSILRDVAVIALISASTFVFSWLSWTYFEKPLKLLRFKEKQVTQFVGTEQRN
ncbi:MAG: acyltransferase [Chloroflexi bacterium]|uniref:acyltransferase family protein n=1 Tax=Candidatus Flexifilum breve TaxID=3140694 RepID=UPI003134E3E8|nr:acyltransferase [Chloroflexota bacterium]